MRRYVLEMVELSIIAPHDIVDDDACAPDARLDLKRVLPSNSFRNIDDKCLNIIGFLFGCIDRTDDFVADDDLNLSRSIATAPFSPLKRELFNALFEVRHFEIAVGFIFFQDDRTLLDGVIVIVIYRIGSRLE